MKRVGLVGGISWTSTLDYYRRLNEGINRRPGGLEFARCLVDSINFGELQRRTWPDSFGLLRDACRRLVAGGAEGIALGATTAHLFADALAAELEVPLIDLRIETARAVRARGVSKVALLGPRFTMEMGFFRESLARHGVEAVVPDTQSVRDYIQQTVRDELGAGVVRAETKAAYLAIVDTLVERGARGVILGCTELPMLLSAADFAMPVFDTVEIHAEAMVRFALGD
jgi:aspartate racemase